jgi:hypothetical protein
VKSVDPVVLFANTNYLHTFSQDFDDVTRLEAEDQVSATMGYAYALNDTITLSTSLSGLFLSETDFDNATLRQQELFSLQFGLTSWLAKGLYIEPTVSYGLNGPGDSFAHRRDIAVYLHAVAQTLNVCRSDCAPAPSDFNIRNPNGPSHAAFPPVCRSQPLRQQSPPRRCILCRDERHEHNGLYGRGTKVATHLFSHCIENKAWL